jgi:hypothetical protein
MRHPVKAPLLEPHHIWVESSAFHARPCDEGYGVYRRWPRRWAGSVLLRRKLPPEEFLGWTETLEEAEGWAAELGVVMALG